MLLRIAARSVPGRLLLDLCAEVGLRNLRGDRQAAGDRLQAAALAAAAQAASGGDLHVADFHARDVLALNDLAVVHAAAADAGPGEDADHRARSLGRPKQILRVHARIHVVDDAGRDAKGRLQGRPQVDVVPAQIGGLQTMPFSGSTGPGHPMPIPASSWRIDLGRIQRLLDRLHDPSTPTFCPPSPRVFLRLRPSTLNESSNTVAMILVPPKSKPTHRCAFAFPSLLSPIRPFLSE